MALLEDLAKGVSPTGLAVGVGAAFLLPVLAPAASNVLRPAALAIVRTSITLYRSTVEPIAAAVGDLVTEAQLELATASASEPPAAPTEDDAKDAKGSRGRNRSGHHG